MGGRGGGRRCEPQSHCMVERINTNRPPRPSAAHLEGEEDVLGGDLEAHAALEGVAPRIHAPTPHDTPRPRPRPGGSPGAEIQESLRARKGGSAGWARMQGG